MNYYLLCYFNTKILFLNQVTTISLNGNHEYHTRGKDTINADLADLLSALSKVESNLIQNITTLKDEVINSKNMIIENIQDENKHLKTKVNVLENKIIDLEIQNSNVHQYSRRNNVEILGILQSVSDNQLEEKVVDIMKAIDVYTTKNEIEACHRLGKKKRHVILRVISRKHCLKAARNKNTLKSIDSNAIGIPNANLFISKNLTPANSGILAFNFQKMKRDDEIEKSYTINCNWLHRKKQQINQIMK